MAPRRALARRTQRLFGYWRSETRTIRQGLVALVLSTAAGFVAGLTLSHLTGPLSEFNGLLPLICETGGIRDGDILVSEALGAIRNERTGETLRPEPLPPIMTAILGAGGLVPYMRQNGDFRL